MKQSYNFEREYEIAKREADIANRVIGDLNTDHVGDDGNLYKGDGVDCPHCKNRGYYMAVIKGGSGEPYTAIRTCEKCFDKRNNIRRLRESGLERIAVNNTFGNFIVNDEWQNKMLSIAKKYTNEGADNGFWMYCGGQTGSGKTFVCTAATIELMNKYDAMYIVWPIESRKIKSLTMDEEKYNRAVDKLQNVKLLYIDDFFKPIFNSDGFEISISKADVMLAYNIINYRYNSRLPTIISSELYTNELSKIDGAIAGRIIESCGEYAVNIGRDGNRNYRLKKNTI